MLKPFKRKRPAWLKKLGIHFMFRLLLNSFITYQAANIMSKVDIFIYSTYIKEVPMELQLQHNLDAAVLENISTPDTRTSVSAARVLSSAHQFVVFEGKTRKQCKMHCPKCHSPGYDGQLALCYVIIAFLLYRPPQTLDVL